MGNKMIGIRELKASLSSCLRRVKGGETIVITERGRPVGLMSPIETSLHEKLQIGARSHLWAWNGKECRPAPPKIKARGKVYFSRIESDPLFGLQRHRKTIHCRIGFVGDAKGGCRIRNEWHDRGQPGGSDGRAAKGCSGWGCPRQGCQDCGSELPSNLAGTGTHSSHRRTDQTCVGLGVESRPAGI